MFGSGKVHRDDLVYLIFPSRLWGELTCKALKTGVRGTRDEEPQQAVPLHVHLYWLQ